MDVLRPFLLVACVAFTIGFVGYWALGRVVAPPAAAQELSAPPASEQISAPDDWNPLKRI